MIERKRAIVFGSKRIPYISEPLRSMEIEVSEIYSWGSPLRRLKAAFVLYRLCRKFPDAPIIIDTPQWIGLAALIITALVNKNYILLLRGDIFKESNNVFAIWMNKKILSNAKGIIFLSHYLKLRILNEMLSHKNVTVIPCPYLLKPHNANRANNCKKILTVTGFYFYEKVKPLFVAMDVIDEFLHRFPDVTWDICGGGKYLKEAVKKVGGLKNHSRIILHGHCNDIEDFYKNATVFLYITGLDAFPLVINEAYLYGLPVIANNAMSMPEMIADGEDGFLIDMDSHDWQKKLYERLILLFEAPQTANEMGLKGRRKVMERYNPEQIGMLLEEFISLGSGRE